MKNFLVKTTLALAITAVTVPVTTTVYAAEEGVEAPGVTVSGRMRAGMVCEDSSVRDACSLQNRSSRFRIGASQDLGNGLTAFGKYEFQVDLDEGVLRGDLALNADGTVSKRSATRLAYVGLKGGFGELSIGSRWTPFYSYVTSPIDGSNALGGTWQSGVDDFPVGVGYSSSFRVSDAVVYKAAFGAASLAVAFTADEDPDDDFADVWSTGAGIAAGPVNLGIGYEDADSFSRFGLNANGDFGPINLSASYFDFSDDNDDGVNLNHSAYMVQAIWGFGSRMALLGRFGSTDVDSVDGAPVIADIELSQKLSDHVRWFAGASNTNWDLDGVDNTNKYVLGMRMDF